MKNILIPGGTGFLGKALEQHFQAKGHTVFILTRNPKADNHIFWDGKNLGEWQQKLEGMDIIVNLTGKSVDCRYSEKNKNEIMASRVDSTHILQMAVSLLKNPPELWVNASSATTYIHSENKLMTESTGVIGDDFSMSVCKNWEQAFFETEIPNVRKVAIRTSIVLGKDGGAFPKLTQIARLGLGGQQGSGTQMVSWIHILDFCRALDFIIENHTLSGPVNVTAPEPIPNSYFMKQLRDEMGISFGMPQPRSLLKLGAWMIGTEAELLLKSRNVYPERLLRAGFVFRFFRVELAVADLVGAVSGSPRRRKGAEEERKEVR